MATLRYHWRGSSWSTTQLTWFVTADEAHRGWPRPYPSIAYWITSPTRFHSIFHDPLDGRPDEHIRAARDFLPPGQTFPRWGLSYFLGGLWQHNWDPGYPDEITADLTDVTRGTPPTYQVHPELFGWKNDVAWLPRRRDKPLPDTPPTWMTNFKKEIDDVA